MAIAVFPRDGVLGKISRFNAAAPWVGKAGGAHPFARIAAVGGGYDIGVFGEFDARLAPHGFFGIQL